MRHELRRRFPRRPWLDVVSKADLPRYGLDRAVEALPEGFLDVSTHDGTGIELLKERWEERSGCACWCCLTGEGRGVSMIGYSFFGGGFKWSDRCSIFFFFSRAESV